MLVNLIMYSSMNSFSESSWKKNKKKVFNCFFKYFLFNLLCNSCCLVRIMFTLKRNQLTILKITWLMILEEIASLSLYSRFSVLLLP